jgi:CheY-like chemotaxis protein
MPVKILLADKSITIQKVVEMLFSGKEYEVTCVSDGESALSEAARIVPDVMLVDVDLPRIDGYTFTKRLKDAPALARMPAILMLSRDDVYDAGKGKLSGIADHIAKPFESQELIGKVKKALSAAPAPSPVPTPRTVMASPPKPVSASAQQSPQPKPAPPSPQPMPAPAPAPQPPRQPKQAASSDIFDIIEEAPSPVMAQAAPMPPPPVQAEGGDEEMYEVEPEFEVLPETPEPQQAFSATASLGKDGAWPPMMPEPATDVKPASPPPTAFASPTTTPDAFEADRIFGEEMAAAEETPAPVFEPSAGTPSAGTDLAGPESYDFGEPLAAEAETVLPHGQKAVEEMREGLGLREGTMDAFVRHPDIVSFESLDMASRAPHGEYAYAPPAAPARSAPTPPATRAPESPLSGTSRAPEGTEELLMNVAKDAVEKAVREILERVAWEVIPDLAERLIREEIERLKAER